MPRPSGTWATPRRATSSVERAVSGAAANVISPSRRIIAEMARSARRLAGAIGAEQRGDAALFDLEIEPVQHFDRTVITPLGPRASRIGRSCRAPEVGAHDFRIGAHLRPARRQRSAGRNPARRPDRKCA